jgi:hypothetical protein
MEHKAMEGKNMRNKWAVIAAGVIIVAVAIVVVIMMSTDSKPASYEIKDGELVITCSFGVSVPLEEITSLELTQDAPQVASKTNGAGIGSMQKGEYLLQDGSKARLYIDDEMPPFICFMQGDTVFYLNSDSPEATQALFDELAAAVD